MPIQYVYTYSIATILHNIAKYEDVVNLARFVVMNPIRGGLVKSIRDYSMWDAVFDLEDLLNNDEKQSPRGAPPTPVLYSPVSDGEPKKIHGILKKPMDQE